jgi:hypothetical protein
MSNDITIDWHSNQSALIADLQKQLAEMKKNISGLQQIGQAGTAAGNAIVAGAKAGTVSLREVGQISEATRNYQRAQIEAAREQYRQTSQAISQQQQQKLITRELAAAQRQAAKDARDARLADIAGQREAAAKFERHKREQEDLIRQAERIRQMNRTPKEAARENYAAGLAKAEALRQGGNLSDEDFLRERSRLIQVYKQESGLIDERNRKKKESAEIAKQAARDEAEWMSRLAKKSQDLSAERAKAGASDRHQQKLAEQASAAARRQQEAEQAAAEKAAKEFLALKDKARQEAAKADQKSRADAAKVEAEWMARLAEKSKQLSGERARAGASDAAAQQAAERASRKRADADKEGLAVTRSVMTNEERRAQQIGRLNRLLSQGSISQETYTRAVRLANAEMVSQSSLWQKLPSQLTSFLTVAGLTSTAIATIRAEFENLKRVQKEAESTTLSFAQAEEQAQQSLDETMTPEQLNERIKDMARAKQMSPTALMRQANQVLGVKDDKTTAKEALDVMEAMVEFSRLNPEDAAANVSAVLGMRAAMPGQTPMEILGAIQQAKISSKVAKNSEFASNIVPGAAAARAYGDTPQQFFGLASAIGGQMQDISGRRTGTAIIDLEKDLAILSAGVESGSLGGEPVKGGLGANTLERLRNIAKNPAFAGLRDRLLGQNEDPEIEELFKKAGRMTTESKSFGAIRLLYQNDEAAWKSLESKLQEQVTGGAAAAVVRRQLAGFSATPEQQTARAQDRVKSVAELAQLENQTGARGAMSREGLETILRSAGISRTEQYLQGIRFEAQSDLGRDDPATQLQQILTGRAQSLRGPKRESRGAGSDKFLVAGLEAIGLLTPQTREATAEEKAAADSLTAAAAALMELVKLEQQRRAPVVQVNMPPGQGNDRPDVPRAEGLQNRQGGKF